ncbi:MAG: SDR family oxidoreductase [Chloroflexi bacterium]|nr:SDR family oxidoreductase [Chloroflexota bacterium]
MRFRDKVVLVTGAGCAIGMGRQIALDFAREGARVVASDIDVPAVEETVAMIAQAGGEAIAVPCDVFKTDDVNNMVQQALAKYGGGIDVLVNNAGIAKKRAFVEMTDEEWNRTLGTNLGGAYRCARAVVPTMIDQGFGRIVSISSLMGSSWGWVDHVHYNAAKAGIEGLTRGLAIELGPKGVTANAIAPGFIWTAQSTSKDHSLGPEGMKVAEGYIPLRRYGVPSDISDVVLFFASDAARYITGQVLLVDGGVTLGDLTPAFAELS